MKVFASTFLLLIMAGCSSDEGSTALPAESPAVYKLNNKNNSVISPHNPLNSYDYTGAIYYQLLEEFYKSDHSALTLQQVVVQGETLAFLNPAFLNLDGLDSYESITADAIEPYLTINGQDVNPHLAAGYSLRAKDIYSQLDNQLRLFKVKDSSYQDAYAAIVETEALINAEQDITEHERTAMLVTTSIMRNALHHDGKRRRRDRDWEWMTGHVVATANASLESVPEAIIMSFATDVYQN